MPIELCSDSDLASLLRISRSWVRKQRMYRRAGLTHALTIDPIMIGSRPRYRLADVEAWLEAQKPGAVHDWAPLHIGARPRPGGADRFP